MPAGQPKKFKSGDELLDYWKQFCSGKRGEVAHR